MKSSIYHNLEREMGIGPTLSAWKAGVLPLYDSRIPHFRLFFTKESIKTFGKAPGLCLKISKEIFLPGAKFFRKILSIFVDNS